MSNSKTDLGLIEIQDLINRTVNTKLQALEDRKVESLRDIAIIFFLGSIVYFIASEAFREIGNVFLALFALVIFIVVQVKIESATMIFFKVLSLLFLYITDPEGLYVVLVVLLVLLNPQKIAPKRRIPVTDYHGKEVLAHQRQQKS